MVDADTAGEQQRPGGEWQRPIGPRQAAAPRSRRRMPPTTWWRPTGLRRGRCAREHVAGRRWRRRERGERAGRGLKSGAPGSSAKTTPAKPARMHTAWRQFSRSPRIATATSVAISGRREADRIGLGNRQVAQRYGDQRRSGDHGEAASELHRRQLQAPGCAGPATASAPASRPSACRARAVTSMGTPMLDHQGFEDRIGRQ